MERLHKVIANSGILSRRKAEEAIRQGRVEVNGVAVTELGQKVRVSDEIRVDGERVSRNRRKTTVVLHKPAEVISTRKDPFGRRCVSDFLPSQLQDLYPVNRLDYRSEGLVVMTNDGEFAQKCMDRSQKWARKYRIRVKGTVTEASLKKLQARCHLEEGVFKLQSVRILKQIPAGKTDLVIETTDSYPDLIQRICYRAGHPVLKLQCTAVGPLELGNLPRGHFRNVSAGEMNLPKASS